MCQYSKGLYNSENQYFSNELYVMLQKHSWEKKIHPMFKRTQYILMLQKTKSSLMVSDSAL